MAPATAPCTYRALSGLWADAITPDASRATVDASAVLTALWTAAALIDAEDPHIVHWITNCARLSGPRRILADHRPRAARRHLRDLVDYDDAEPGHRAEVRAIILTALNTTTTENR